MSRQWCGQDHEHRCIVATEPCGCIAAVALITHEEAEAYKSAAAWAKRGHRITEMSTDEFRAGPPWHCPEHPKGPPWWKSNGGRGKRPTAAPTVGLGL